MRKFCYTVLVLFLLTVGLAFFFGIFTMSIERQESAYAISLLIHTDTLKTTKESVEQKAEKIGETVKERANELVGVATAKGTISKMDETDQSFLLKTADQKELLIHVDSSSQITGGTLKGLRMGDRVKVAYKTKDDRHLAQSITIEPAS